VEFKIRRFEPKDLERVIYINRVCLPENYWPGFYLENYRNCPEAFLVAEVGGEIVGYVMCRMERGFSDFGKFSIVKKGHVISIAVLKEYRRRGIGLRLMVDSMKAMAERGAKEIYLEVRVSNFPAINLYRKLGYEVVRRIRGYYADGEDAYVMSWKVTEENLKRIERLVS